MYTFDWNPTKSERNKQKHGVSFPDATVLWQDPRLMRVPSKIGGLNEDRFLYIGKIDGRLWVAITTERSETVRIISV